MSQELQTIPEEPTEEEYQSLLREYEPSLISEIKSKYINGASIKELSNEYAIDRKILRRWVRQRDSVGKSWATSRDDVLAFNIQESQANRQGILMDITKVSLTMVHEALQARSATLDKNGERKPLTLMEAKMVSDIVCQFDKLQRLDIGLPTEISKANFSCTVEDLKSAIQKDQFLDLIPLKDGTYAEDTTDVRDEGKSIDKG